MNPDTSNRTLKNLSSLTTFPYVIEDNASANKEENLAVSAFDTETYHRKGETQFKYYGKKSENLFLKNRHYIMN